MTNADMENNTKRCLDWHKGCETDLARNKFVIPNALIELRKRPAKKIAFFGASTGYIPMKIASQIASSVSIDLVDLDQEALEFSKSLDFNGHTVFFHSFDITQDMKKIQPVDTLFISNTLLEFPINDGVSKNLASYVVDGGQLLIFMPDILKDVARENENSGGVTLSEFVSGQCNIPNKTDSFTNLPYKFYVHRYLYLISYFTNAGMKLAGVEFSEKELSYIMLRFEK